MYAPATQQQWNKLMETIAASGTTAIIRRPGREMSQRIGHQTFSLPKFPFHEFENDQLVLSLGTRTSGKDTIGVVDVHFRQWELQFVQGMTAMELGALKALLTGEGVCEAGRQEHNSSWQWYPVDKFPYEEYDRNVLRDVAFSVISDNIDCRAISLRPVTCRGVQGSDPFAGLSSNTFVLPEIISDFSKEFSRQMPDDFNEQYRMDRLCLLLQLTLPPPSTPKAF
jgi:hypothetical protein